jgi:hypothetical protein
VLRVFRADEQTCSQHRQDRLPLAHSPLGELHSLLVYVGTRLPARSTSGPLLSVFTVAIGQWITDRETPPLVEIEREVMR